MRGCPGSPSVCPGSRAWKKFHRVSIPLLAFLLDRERLDEGFKPNPWNTLAFLGSMVAFPLALVYASPWGAVS